MKDQNKTAIISDAFEGILSDSTKANVPTKEEIEQSIKIDEEIKTEQG